ncbi:MAG: hypothetical protein ACRBDI_01695 [Alphaproteobacteria bacterium]
MFLSVRFFAMILFFSLFFTPLTLFSAKADEIGIFERFKKPMMKVPELSQEDFIAASSPIKDKPYDQESLAYSMRIPKDWTVSGAKSSSNFMLSEKLFLELDSFFGPPSAFGRSRIEIQALNMEKNLTVEQWYLMYILESGLTTEGFVAHNENKVEALMVVMEGDFSYYLRTLVVKNENKIIMVKYFVPVNFMQKEASIQEAVIGSFEITNPLPPQEITSEIYRFLDVAELKSPSGWKIYSSPMRSVDYMDISMVNLEEVRTKTNSADKVSVSSNGKIDITLVSTSEKQTLIDEIAAYKKKIELSGVLIGKKTEGYGDFIYNKDMDFALTEVYLGVDSTNNQTEYEFWFSVFVGGNYYYFIMLLTPSRNENFSIWADNIQNYKFIVSSLKPMSGAFLERQ